MGNKCSFINFCPRAVRANTEKTLKNKVKDKKKMNKLSLLRMVCKWCNKDDSLAPTVPIMSETPLTIRQIHSDDESTLDVNGTDAALTTAVPFFEINLFTEHTSGNVYVEETGKIIFENGIPTTDAIPEFVDDTPAADVDEIAVVDPVKVVGAGSQVSNSNVKKSPVSNDHHALQNDAKVVYVLVPDVGNRLFTIQAQYNNNYGYGSGLSKRVAKRNAAWDLLDVMTPKHENLNRL